MRRRWPWFLVGGVAGLATALWLALPWLTVLLVERRCPLPLGERGALTGVGWNSQGPAGAVTVSMDPGQAWHLAQAAGAPWFPGRCLTGGQRAWGQGPGGLPWRLDLVAGTAVPQVWGHPTPAQADAVIAALRQPRGGWDAGIRELVVTSLPADGALTRLAVVFRGHVNAMSLQLDIDRLEGVLTIEASPEGPTARVLITTLALHDAPGDGLKEVLAETAARALTKALRKAPAWTPWDTQVDLQVGGPVVEL